MTRPSGTDCLDCGVCASCIERSRAYYEQNKAQSVEALADFAHRQWSGWMAHLFSKGTDNDDGTHTIPATVVPGPQTIQVACRG